MCAGRGCRAPHAEGVPGWWPGPLRRVAIRRRGTRAGECEGRGISHLGGVSERACLGEGVEEVGDHVVGVLVDLALAVAARDVAVAA